ncbi:YoaH family protein [Candidatus Enterovibrio altilux]|uniref:Uncharacterized protein n=1 Tax=Candidatus Enterovibrio altilux TaxID=1927128 RepID=A0A291B6Z3_9GAMM|nr:YoaH family protein [Candidatus Enterovibrio luxaltus]ATF08772.1 hypothetical protein BTN50_0232 [Candidatus Enterovibrio luxaltus]
MNNIPTLTHSEQQEATDRIHALMAKGMSSGEAIMIVANDIRLREAPKNNAS